MFKFISIFMIGLLLVPTTSALSMEEINSLINKDKISTQDIQVQSANFLATRDIIVDQSNNPNLYNLGDSIQRKAVMKVVMKLSGIEIVERCDKTFLDVQDGWHCKYVELALENGYIAKNPNFRPDDNITKTEAMKLIMKAKGISKIRESSNWQEDYMETAFHYGIIDKKYYDYNTLATRGWIFEIATSAIKREESGEEVNLDNIMSGQ